MRPIFRRPPPAVATSSDTTLLQDLEFDVLDDVANEYGAPRAHRTGSARDPNDRAGR